jgi:hypothetical protein
MEHSFQRASAETLPPRLFKQLKERGNLRADCPLCIVDFNAHCEDPGIVILRANSQRARGVGK